MRIYRYILLLLATFLVATMANAQKDGMLKSHGTIPADLKLSIDELYQQDLQRAKKYAGGRVNDKQKVLMESYNISKMMANGRIVYGDPITKMIEHIADTLLKNYPTLRSELRFYTVKSPNVNAFMTAQGMLFVNTGMVAQVQDEAELAFVISHEIIHYFRNHSLEVLVGNNGKKKHDDKELEKEAEELNNFLRFHNRSREMENEADSLGLAMFYINSPYDKNVTEGIFDVLQYSYLPFDEIAFDTTFFNNQYYRLEGCWLDSVAYITSRDNYDDSRSTHPNILSRRQKCGYTLSAYKGGEKFVTVTKEEFEHIRHLARLESIRQMLIHSEYPGAFYNAWVLRETDKTKQYDELLSQVMTQAIYDVVMLRNHTNSSKIIADYKNAEGEIQQIYYALNKMSNEQITLAALHLAWKEHQRFPQNETLTAIADDLIKELRISLGKSPADYVATAPKKEQETQTDTITQEEDKALTKYERIKQKRKTQIDRKQTSYALIDLMTDDDFSKRLNNQLTKPTTNNDTQIPKISSLADSEAVIVFDPSYYIFNYKTDRFSVERSNRNENSLKDAIIAAGERFGKRSIDFSDRRLHDMTTDEEYNDFLTICEWVNEFWGTKGMFESVRMTQPRMNDLLKRHNARVIEISALLNVEQIPNEKGNLSLAILPILPIALEYFVTGTEQTVMVNILVDARDGKLLARENYNYRRADHNAQTSAMLYDSYYRAMYPGHKPPIGHVGHRFAIIGGANLGMSGWGTMGIKKYLAFSPWASLEFAITRNKSIVVSARYQKGYKELGTYSYDQWLENRHDIDENLTNVTGQSRSKDMLNIGLEVRLFTESDFAPFGRYIDVGANYIRLMDIAGVKDDNTFGLHIGVGRNYILLERLLINYQIDYAYTYGWISKTMFSFNDYGYDHFLNAFMQNVLTFKLGIGFIPF